MPTLEEVLNGQLDAGQTKQVEKTASAVTETDEIEKLAMEIGLGESKTETSPQTQSMTKEAEMKSMYEELFPEDAAISEKVASAAVATVTEDQEKVAAAEMALGARAYDHFQDRLQVRLEKLAADAISQGAEPPQAQPNNKSGGNAPIDTTPQVTNELPAENGPAVVGKEENRAGAMQVKAAAVRKQMLLAQLEE